MTLEVDAMNQFELEGLRHKHVFSKFILGSSLYSSFCSTLLLSNKSVWEKGLAQYPLGSIEMTQMNYAVLKTSDSFHRRQLSESYVKIR